MSFSFGNPPLPGAASGARTGTAVRNARILVVGDEPLSCRLVETILRRNGFTDVRTSTDGRAVLDAIDAIEPDLVLLDIQMAAHDWVELLARVRAVPRFLDLPVLMQTTSDDRKELAMLFAAGASGAILKPIMPSVLVAQVTVHLERLELVRELRQYHLRTSQELDAARRMQHDLLPSPALQQSVVGAAGLRIGSYCRSSSEIGGDLWGILPIDASSFGIYLADFAGHGVTAALNTFRLHAQLLELKALHREPAVLLARLNDRLASVLSPGQFATFLYAIIDSSTDWISLASAGAPPPLIKPDHAAPAVFLEAPGLPLGIFRGARYQRHDHRFGPDALLLLFSDGLLEFKDNDGDRLGEEGIRSVLDDCPPCAAPLELVDRLLGAAGIDRDCRLTDDTTVICLDRRDDIAGLQPGHGADGAAQADRPGLP